MPDTTQELFIHGVVPISDEDVERIVEIEETIDELELLLDLVRLQGLHAQQLEIEDHIFDLEDAKAEIEEVFA